MNINDYTSKLIDSMCNPVLKTGYSTSIPSPSNTIGELLYLLDTQEIWVSNGSKWAKIGYSNKSNTCSTCSFRDPKGYCLLKRDDDKPYVHDFDSCDNYFNEAEFTKSLYKSYSFS